eukprot:scaffold87813_cov23-Tisochrysis_lutea.AAC.1
MKEKETLAQEAVSPLHRRAHLVEIPAHTQEDCVETGSCTMKLFAQFTMLCCCDASSWVPGLDRFQGGKVYELTFDLSGQDLLLKNIENCPSGKHHRSPFLSIQL